MVFNKTESDKLVARWSPLLEGITNDYTKRVTAQLMENQGRFAKSGVDNIDEAASYTAGTTVGKLGTFQKWAFPLIKRIYPKLIANSIIGIQPMQGPVGQIFYLGHSRHRNGGGGTNSQVIHSKYYGQYAGFTTAPIFSGANLNLNNASSLQMSAFLGLGTSAGPGPANSTYGFPIGAPSTTFGGKIAAWTVSNAVQVNNIYGFGVSAGEVLQGNEIPELNIHIEQQPVQTRTRKMRALWTIEAAQDLKAYHGLDLEKELTELLGNELRLEIDRELIEDLRMISYDISGSFGGWDRRMLDMGNSNSFPTDNGAPSFTANQYLYDFNNAPTNPAGTLRNVFLVDLTSTSMGLSPRHVGEVYANLLATINFASQDIYKTTLRGPGTFLLTSPLVASLLESSAKLEGGIMDKDGPTNMGTNIEFRGKFAGKYDLFVDPLYPEDEIMVGYKGKSAMDAGYMYCPYIALQSLPTVTDPETFQPRKGILTRYGKAVVAPESRFYRIIRLVGPVANYLYAPFFKNTSNIPVLG